MRKPILIVVAVVALVAASTVGAVVKYTIFTIKPTRYAHLAGTNLYCQSMVTTTKLRAFECLTWTDSTPRRVRNGFGLIVDERGVTIERSSNGGKKFRTVRYYTNP